MTIDYWIDRLEGAFEKFALIQVLGSMGGLADESGSRRADRAGWWGVSPEYYSAQDEHDIEVVEHLIGSAFVLAQTSITQAVSILKRMHEDAGEPVWIPKDKAAVLATAAPVHAGLGISHIAIINTAANYYKHSFEWREEDWVGAPPKSKTIASALKLGLGPNGYHNMEYALRELRVYPSDIASIGRIVGNWRESLADHLRAEGKKNGLPISPRFPEDQGTDREASPQPIIVEDEAPF